MLPGVLLKIEMSQMISWLDIRSEGCWCRNYSISALLTQGFVTSATAQMYGMHANVMILLDESLGGMVGEPLLLPMHLCL